MVASGKTDDKKSGDLARIRANQQRSRARRKQYIQELEDQLKAYEEKSVQESAEIQAAARTLAAENKRLHLLLMKHGITDTLGRRPSVECSATMDNAWLSKGHDMQSLGDALASGAMPTAQESYLYRTTSESSMPSLHNHMSPSSGESSSGKSLVATPTGLDDILPHPEACTTEDAHAYAATLYGTGAGVDAAYGGPVYSDATFAGMLATAYAADVASSSFPVAGIINANSAPRKGSQADTMLDNSEFGELDMSMMDTYLDGYDTGQ